MLVPEPLVDLFCAECGLTQLFHSLLKTPHIVCFDVCIHKWHYKSLLYCSERLTRDEGEISCRALSIRQHAALHCFPAARAENGKFRLRREKVPLLHCKRQVFPVQCFDPAKKEDLIALIDGNFDVAFLCLHGRKGEDGVIQGFLETIGLPYIGPGVWSSATAINKARSKEFYRLAGVPTAPSMTISSSDSLDVDSIVAQIGTHVVVKPATEGSSIGISIVDTREALEEAISEAFEHDNEIVVEKFVQGREFHRCSHRQR